MTLFICPSLMYKWFETLKRENFKTVLLLNPYLAAGLSDTRTSQQYEAKCILPQDTKGGSGGVGQINLTRCRAETLTGPHSKSPVLAPV